MTRRTTFPPPPASCSARRAGPPRRTTRTPSSAPSGPLTPCRTCLGGNVANGAVVAHPATNTVSTVYTSLPLSALPPFPGMRHAPRFSTPFCTGPGSRLWTLACASRSASATPLGCCHPARLRPSLLGFGHPCSALAIPARLRPSLLGFGHPCSASAIPAWLRPSPLGTYHLPSRQAPLLLPPVSATPRGDRPAPPPSLVAAHHAHRAVLTRCRPLCH
jgi:hypothetical protein